ncbi:MAG: hypothetical protein GXN99_02785, partial [Candidatus Nanohaloarchaeota archaeon]|nr:hypothetical protein [Candidatus Nanohaloarchaeota archaeon]
MKYKGSEYAIAVGIGMSIVLATFLMAVYKHHVASMCEGYYYLVHTNFDGLIQAGYVALSAPSNSRIMIELPVKLKLKLDDKGNLSIMA